MTMIKRPLPIFFLVFLALFALRLTYGYVTMPNGEVLPNNNYDNGSYNFDLLRKNYAGQNKKGIVSPAPAGIDQRFEKVAALGLASIDFDRDEENLRAIADSSQALIQHEQAYGLAGQRQLQLALGVSPELFDEVIAKIRDIGRLTGFQVNKVDKTNEYHALLAQQISLEKSRDNLVALKSRDAILTALIALEAQILDLETQIQNIGVSVGEFDSEFEFVTIKLTLIETRAAAIRDLSVYYRAKVALEWSSWVILGLMAAFAAFCMGLAALAFIIREIDGKKLAAK